MEIIDYIRAIRKHWLLVVIPTIVAGVLGVGLTLVLPKSYTSEADLLITVNAAPGTLLDASSYLKDATPNFVVLATSPTVLDPVIKSLNMQTTSDQLAKKVSVSQSSGTTVIEINATASTATQARDIAADVATGLSQQITSMNPTAAKGASDVTKFVPLTITPAAVPSSPSAPNSTVFVIAGLIVGLVVGLILAIARDVTKVTVVARQSQAEAGRRVALEN